MRNQKRLAAVLVCLALLPFVVLCFYSHPGADDFTDAVQRRELGFWTMQRDLYMGLTGRLFTSVLLSGASPIILGPLTHYWVAPLFTLLFLAGSLYVLTDALLGEAWSRSTKALATGVVLALWLLQNPSVAESVYWFNGLAVYTVPTALLLLWLAAFVRYWQAPAPRQRMVWLGLSVVLGTCVLWSNEVLALPVAAAVGGIALWEWWRQGRRRAALGAVAAWFGVALAASVLAPGNMARAGIIGMAVPWYVALIGSIAGPTYLLLNWLSSGVLMATTVLVLPALARLVGQRPVAALRRLAGLSRTQLLVGAGALLAFLPLAALPSYWATGGLMPPRARASLYLLFLLGWFAAVLAGLVAARHTIWLRNAAIGAPRWPSTVAALLWGWLLLSLATDHNLRVAHRDMGRASNNAVIAYRDWLSGSASRYDATLRARYHLLRTSPLPRLQVAALPRTARPKTLLYYDVTTDSTCGINLDYAHFFFRKSVWTGPGGQGPPPKFYQPPAEDE